MAEERLIDRDKDKKYRFRINENGEEELFIDDGLTEEGEEQPDEIGFEIPVVLEDDEEAAVMTPEQLAEKLKRAERERQERADRAAALLQTAEEELKKSNYSTALEAVCEAEELTPDDGEIYALKLKVYTQNFGDYSQIVKAAEVAPDVADKTSAETKAQMLTAAETGLYRNISELSETVKKLGEENERKKAERAVTFDADLKRALKKFFTGATLFLAAFIATICFIPFMFSAQNGSFLILTCVFGGISAVLFIVLVFLGRSLNIAGRRVRLNKRNTSTKLGRELIEKEKLLKAFNAVYNALK